MEKILNQVHVEGKARKTLKKLLVQDKVFTFLQEQTKKTGESIETVAYKFAIEAKGTLEERQIEKDNEEKNSGKKKEAHNRLKKASRAKNEKEQVFETKQMQQSSKTGSIKRKKTRRKSVKILNLQVSFSDMKITLFWPVRRPKSRYRNHEHLNACFRKISQGVRRQFPTANPGTQTQTLKRLLSKSRRKKEEQAPELLRYRFSVCMIDAVSKCATLTFNLFISATYFPEKRRRLTTS